MIVNTDANFLNKQLVKLLICCDLLNVDHHGVLTPHFDMTDMDSDISCWNWIIWHLSLRYDLNHLIAFSFNLYKARFYSTISWFTMSNSLCRSRRTSPVRCPLSILAAHCKAAILARAVSQVWNPWNLTGLVVSDHSVAGMHRHDYVNVFLIFWITPTIYRLLYNLFVHQPFHF